MQSIGEGAFSCCGITLPVLSPEEPEEAHAVILTQIDGELSVTMRHPMTKTHFLSFAAVVTSERVILTKLYPEQDPELRFPLRGRGRLYVYCNQHGLFQFRV